MTDKPRRKPRQIESGIQQAFVQWCNWNIKRYPELELAYAIPNGGARNAITGAILKREGVKAGVPDWCLPAKTKQFGALYIEFKRPKGMVRTEQYDYIAMLREYGNRAEICYSCEEAVKIVEDYLG